MLSHLSPQYHWPSRRVEHSLIIQATLFLKWLPDLGVLWIVVWCRPQAQRIT
jgi:hypothetical protein